MRTIAVDLDDTLNDFTETLRRAPLPFDPSYALPEATFDAYLDRVRRDVPDPSDLLATDFSFFKYRIHQRCWELAEGRQDGIEFVRRRRRAGWRIVICTYRDLRRANDCTRRWLRERDVPFDHLFMAWNKIAFCRLWGIVHLVDDDPFNVVHGARHGVNVYYPRMAKHEGLDARGARGFEHFSEIEPWIGE
jgi:5'(3')-deoxyribonucleotidase